MEMGTSSTHKPTHEQTHRHTHTNTHTHTISITRKQSLNDLNPVPSYLSHPVNFKTLKTFKVILGSLDLKAKCECEK